MEYLIWKDYLKLKVK